LKICGFEMFKVAVPFIPRLKLLDETLGVIPIVILSLETDEGLVGLGEAFRGQAEEAVRQAAQSLLGQDPLELNPQQLPVPQGLAPAFEMALYDIVGKAVGLPVCSLLGARYREKVEVSYWSPHTPPGETAEGARIAVEKGFKSYKLKARPWDIVEQVRAIEEAVGSRLEIVADPNTLFGYPSTAIRLAKQLEAHNVKCFEDPVPKWNLDWYAFMRQKTTVPMALHLGEATDVVNAVKREACDYLNLGGSMSQFVRMANIAEAAGIQVWHGSGVDLGIADMSYVHACAAAKAATLPSDIIGNFLREDDVIKSPIEIVDGYAKVPREPGLGVDFDLQAVEKYRVK